MERGCFLEDLKRHEEIDNMSFESTVFDIYNPEFSSRSSSPEMKDFVNSKNLIFNF